MLAMQITEGTERLDIETPMPLGARVFFGVLALVPLLAPYELIFRIHWTDYLNVFFLFALLICAGAISLSVSLVFAAIAGLSTRLTFDAARSTFTYLSVAPVLRRTETFPLSLVEDVELREHHWSEGNPSYSLAVKVVGGQTIETGSSWSREEVEEARAMVRRFMGRAERLPQSG